MLLRSLDVDHHLHRQVLVPEMEAQTVVLVAVVPVQTAEVVIAMIALMTRSRAVTVVKSLTVRPLAAGTAAVKEAAGNGIRLEKPRKTRILSGIEIEIAFGTDMVIERKKESATKTKIAEKGTASEIVNGTATATVIEIAIAGMIKTATGITEKSETPLVAISLQMLSRQGLITVVCLLVLTARGIGTYQMATRPLGKEDDPLKMR
jgi:hypothetical protein